VYARPIGEPGGKYDAVFFPPSVFPNSVMDGTRHTARGRTAVDVPLISPGAAWLTLDALVSAVRPGEEAIWQEYANAMAIAWKTGTSFGFRDAWAIGVTWLVALGGGGGALSTKDIRSYNV
jgi:penicillin-binding protein 1C